MKIFILNPLINIKGKSIFIQRKRQPLSLAYIASLLREKGYLIKLLDANVLDYQKDQVLREINDFSPDIFILTSSPVDRWECPQSHIDSVFEIINLAKIENTILTGSHGTVTPDWIFKKCKVKYIIRGEPEAIVVNLIEALENKQEIKSIKGVSFREGYKIIHPVKSPQNPAPEPQYHSKVGYGAQQVRCGTGELFNWVNNDKAYRIEDLDQLPLPAYDLLPMDKYRYSFNDLPQPFSIMLTSRGCPFQCIYCLKVMAEGKYIARSSESVIREIEYLINNFNIKSIFFQDWEFTINKERVNKICDLIINKNIKILWGCNSRADNISEDLVKKMKQAGCARINTGFESGCQNILDKIKKNIKIKDLEKAIKICRENKINIGVYSLLNLPGESKKTIKETVKFLKANNIKAMNFNLVVPYFGTELFNQLEKENKENINWDNIENYAGKVCVGQSPFLAKLWLKHYQFQSEFGKFYFLNFKWHLKIIKKYLKMNV